MQFNPAARRDKEDIDEPNRVVFYGRIDLLILCAYNQCNSGIIIIIAGTSGCNIHIYTTDHYDCYHFQDNSSHFIITTLNIHPREVVVYINYACVQWKTVTVVQIH